MIKPDDIHKHPGLKGEQRLRAERAMQQDDLSYMSSLAFEKFDIHNDDLERLNSMIDKKAGRTPGNFNAIIVSLLCGLLIGVSVFFVIFQKSKTHPSISQLEEPEQLKKLRNTVLANDTVFPEIAQLPLKPEEEHYNSIVNQAQEAAEVMETPESISSKSISFPEAPAGDVDIILSFSPNAPVVFISNLKVTNYKLYYFKQNQSINLSVNTGLAAQYESNANLEKVYINRSDNYMAHKIIQRAMKLFNGKHYTNCIEELDLLYQFNKNDANAQFYLGMCYYLTGKYTLAQSFFEKNLDNENNIFHQESDYYQALCLLNTKQTDLALERLQSIINAKGFYSSRAQEVVSKHK